MFPSSTCGRGINQIIPLPLAGEGGRRPGEGNMMQFREYHMKTYYRLTFIVTSFLTLLAIPSLSFAAADDIATIVGNLMDPMQGLAHMLNLASVICGAGFLMASALQYKNHRDNPQEVPLSRPITYLLLGLALVILPYFTMISSGASFLVSLF